MISSEQFEKEIRHLKLLCDKNAEAPNWKICQNKLGIYCYCSSAFEWNTLTLIRQVHIVYNKVYEVPVLWFNFYRQDGSLLKIDEILEIISSEYRCPIKSSLLTSISQGEHPNMGVAFYHIHPCKTQQIMKNICHIDYILSWLSVYGQLVGLTIPLEIYKKADGPD